MPQAARHYREAAVLFARVGDREHSVMADIGLADALTSLGDFDEALRIYARARMRAGTHGLPVLQAIVDESVALLELARGHYPRGARRAWSASRRRYEALAMPQHLAVAEKQLGRCLPRTAPAARGAGAVRPGAGPASRRLRHAGRPGVDAGAARPRAGPAGASRGGGRIRSSRAAALFAAQGNGVGPGGGGAGPRRAGAGRAATRTPRRRWPTAGARRLCRRQSRPKAGCAPTSLRAQAAAAPRPTSPRPRALRRRRSRARAQLQLLPVQVRCLTGQGLVRRAVGDAARGAATAFEAAIDLFEDQRRALPGDEFRSAFLTDHLRPYQELLRMALQRSTRRRRPALASEVLQQLDRFRARSLGRAPGAGTAASAGADADTRGLRARLNWLYRRRQRLQDDGEPPRRWPTSCAAPSANCSNARGASALRRRRRPADRARRRPVRTRRPAARCSAMATRWSSTACSTTSCSPASSLARACACTRHVARLERGAEAVASARFQIETLRHGAAPVQRHLAS